VFVQHLNISIMGIDLNTYRASIGMFEFTVRPRRIIYKYGSYKGHH